MRVLVTGATHGMGKGVAQVLAAQGHEIVVLGRSAALCEALVAELGEGHSHVVCDLSRLREVRAAVDTLVDRFDSLDAIFVNAGIGYAKERVQTEDGLDAHFQVNYLAHFLLTLGLLPLLEQSEHAPRVVFNTPDFGELDFDDLQMESHWDYERGIGQGMVAKRMFLVELHERFRARGAVDPSFIGFHIQKTVWTNQLQLIPTGMRLMAGLARLFGSFIGIEECGRIMAPLFTDGPDRTRARSGKLLTWKAGRFEELMHTDFVRDAENRRRLWDQSVLLCGDERTALWARALERA